MSNVGPDPRYRILQQKGGAPPVTTGGGKCPYCGGKLFMKQSFSLGTPVLLTEEQFTSEQTAKIARKAG